MIKSAPLPDGWPELSPVSEAVIREYPEYRAAAVTDSDPSLNNRQRTGPMFMQLFNHIKNNDIPMTAPVEMGYEQSSSGSDEMTSMAFLYRTADVGPVGNDGPVTVRDVPAQTFASVGVRGDYNETNFRKGLEIVDAWLNQHTDEWEQTGPPRYLGYNGPFTLSSMRYGEVQVPVKPRSTQSETIDAPSAP